ncbi:MAG: hypothetical protein QXI60_09355 [Thermofilaceae archaeon]
MRVEVLADRTEPILEKWARDELRCIDPEARFRFVPCRGRNGDHSDDCEVSSITLEPLCGHWIVERRVPPSVYGADWEWERPEWVVEVIVRGASGEYVPIDGRVLGWLRRTYIPRQFLRWKDYVLHVREKVYDKHRRAERRIDAAFEDAEKELLNELRPHVAIRRALAGTEL